MYFILGIICGFDSDQQSFKKQRSHESLNSSENDQSESEGCIELLETISMDEDYKTIQSDLSSLQSMQTLTQKNNSSNCTDNKIKDTSNKKFCYQELKVKKRAILKEKQSQKICVPIDYEETAEMNDKDKELSKDPHVKDPVMSKGFFFKNAIFRTAQSIIENHERKNAKPKDQAAAACNSDGPSVVKRRDFLNKAKSKASSLKTSPSGDNSESAKSSSSKLSSGNSMGTMKIPGMAHCLVKDVIQPQIKTERGQSGLLRFFESPVFNIHFAVHYLFYSKEPGVLSFIGNKIFSFPNSEVDLYIPQLILMYIQIDELADVLDKVTWRYFHIKSFDSLVYNFRSSISCIVAASLQTSVLNAAGCWKHTISTWKNTLQQI